MPAIQPARLKQQAALLVEHFADPAAFVRSLHHLLDFYADRAHRPGQSGEPAPLLAAYNVRPPVLRQILQELAPLADQEPQLALALIDALWEQAYLEFRLLAASLLGQLPPAPAHPILSRAQSWIKADPQVRMVTAVLGQGLARLRRENPDELIRLVEDWLSNDDIFYQQSGLQALLPMINDLSFENLPLFFRLIYPFTRVAPPALRPDLLDVLGALARRSPQETAYLLRQNLDIPNNTDASWLIRQCLGDFPPEIRESLRMAVRDAAQE